MISRGLGRVRPPLLQLAPWAAQFGPGLLGTDTGQAVAAEFYFGGLPPPVVEIPLEWLSPPIQFRHDPPLGIAEVGQESGATARAVNQATVDAGRGRNWTFTATLDSVIDVDASNLAAWAVDTYDIARPRSSVLQLVLNGRAETEIWRILGVTQGRHIRLTGAPGETAILNSNPYFDGSSSDWVGQSGATIAPSSLYYHAGSGSLEITPPGAVATVGAATATYAVLPNTPYVAAAWLFSVSGWSDARTVIDWFGPSGFISTGGLGSPTAVPAGVWTLSSRTITSPSTATHASLRVRQGSTPTAGDVLYADDATLTGPQPGHCWPAGATDHVVEGIAHQFTDDARIVRWSTTPIIGEAAGTAGPWFYSDSSSTAGTDVIPF